MTTPSDYLEARKRVEALAEGRLGVGYFEDGALNVPALREDLRALLSAPPLPTVDRVAVCISTRLSLGLGIDLPCVETDKIAQTVLALFTTPEGAET